MKVEPFGVLYFYLANERLFEDFKKAHEAAFELLEPFATVSYNYGKSCEHCPRLVVHGHIITP